MPCSASRKTWAAMSSATALLPNWARTAWKTCGWWFSKRFDHAAWSRRLSRSTSARATAPAADALESPVATDLSPRSEVTPGARRLKEKDTVWPAGHSVGWVAKAGKEWRARDTLTVRLVGGVVG